MLFELEGTVKFSACVKDARDDVLQEIARLNDKYARMAPGKETKIEVIELKDEELNVRIISHGYPRAHDALLQLKNQLASSLGRKHRIGVRGVIASRYDVCMEGVDEGKVRELARGIADVELRDGIPWVKFENLSEGELRGRMVDRMIKIARAEEERGGGVEYGYVLRFGRRREVPFRDDVNEFMQKLGWIKRFPGRAQWILLPPAAKVLMTLRDMIVDYVLRPMGFEEAMFPKLIHFDVMKKMPGYFEHIPEGMFYVICPPRDPRVFEEFKKSATLQKEIRGDLLKKILPEPEYVLAPAQCEPFYQLFSREIVRSEDLPIKLYDCSGWTWRAEGGGVEGIVRTTEFWRLESVWLGTPEQAVEIRDEITERTFKLVDDVLEMNCRVVVGAPFYAVGRGEKVDISSSEKIPTLDVEVWLPYRGTYEGSEWLEIGAFTCHRRKYVDGFHIREVKERDIWTGCGGFGLTRWLAGFLAQYGFEEDKWPGEMRRRIGKLPKVPRVVSWPEG